MKDIRCRPFSLHDVLSSINFGFSFYLAIPVKINNLSCLRNSIHLLQKRVKCLIHEWHHLKWRIKEKWKTKSMLKAIILKLKVQIKIANKKYPFERFHPHHNSGRIPGGGGGCLRNFWVWDVPLRPWNPWPSNLPIWFFIFIYFLSGNSRFPCSRLKSPTNWSVSWKMIPYSRPKLSNLYTLSQSKQLEKHTLHSYTLHSYIAHIWQYPPPLGDTP